MNRQDKQLIRAIAIRADRLSPNFPRHKTARNFMRLYQTQPLQLSSIFHAPDFYFQRAVFTVNHHMDAERNALAINQIPVFVRLKETDFPVELQDLEPTQSDPEYKQNARP